jgi:hypothetical protein
MIIQRLRLSKVCNLLDVCSALINKQRGWQKLAPTPQKIGLIL